LTAEVIKKELLYSYSKLDQEKRGNRDKGDPRRKGYLNKDRWKKFGRKGSTQTLRGKKKGLEGGGSARRESFRKGFEVKGHEASVQSKGKGKVFL